MASQMEGQEWKPAPLHLVTLVEIYAHPKGPTSEMAGVDLCNHELATFDAGPKWRLTERGTAWLEMLLATPLPVMAWIDPRKP